MAALKLTVMQIVNAAKLFDEEERGTPAWADWEFASGQRYGVYVGAQLYPPKQLIALATGLKKKTFSGGERHTNRALESLGLDVVRLPRLWLITTSTAGDTQYAGNSGHVDRLDEWYEYTNRVPHARSLAVGDSVMLVHRLAVAGIARIHEITKRRTVLDFLRCPRCANGNLKRLADGRYYCDQKKRHDGLAFHFLEPERRQEEGEVFRATFSESFVPVERLSDGPIPVHLVWPACIALNKRHSIKLVHTRRLYGALDGVAPRLLSALAADLTAFEEVRDADSEVPNNSEEIPYTPSGLDTRLAIMRTLKARRGQGRFRRDLKSAYGAQCMVTGCVVPQLLEACHIDEWRGDEYNHAQNGLLLRSDIHTLFDLDLIAIEPDALTIHLARQLRWDETYAWLEGQTLRTAPEMRPDIEALRRRWVRFTRNSAGH